VEPEIIPKLEIPFSWADGFKEAGCEGERCAHKRNEYTFLVNP
jgi:hypothetical protein